MGCNMHKVSYAFVALSLLLGSFAQAQTAGTITFTANRTSSTSGFAPVLTWSTSPVASSCTASGAWSGTKFASGSETLATITSSKSYTLTCSWGGSGTATLNWTAPTRNSDGTTLTNLAGFKVLYGTSTSALTNTKSINDPRATSTSIGSLGAGTWYFTMRSVNSNGVESDNAAVQQKTIAGASAAKTVNITISGSTPPPSTSLKTVSTRVYDVIWDSSAGVRVRGREVGTIALNKACDPNYKVGTEFYGVNKSDARITVTPRSNRVIVRCQLK
jgi:hypothetical protein